MLAAVVALKRTRPLSMGHLITEVPIGGIRYVLSVFIVIVDSSWALMVTDREKTAAIFPRSATQRPVWTAATDGSVEVAIVGSD